MNSGTDKADQSQVFPTKDRNCCRESRQYCGLGARSTIQGGTADMYRMSHHPRCVCLCPTRPLLSSLWHLHNQADTVWPKWHHHRLFALSGNYNATEQSWKSFEILEYKPESKSWVFLTQVPDAMVAALFQVKSFDFMHAASYESRIFVKRMGDGHINGAVYDLEKNTWATEWRVPVDAMSWFRGIYPIQEVCAPWEKYMPNCHTHAAAPVKTEASPDAVAASK